MSERTILNINGSNRTINPRSGSSVYVDLVSNQTIGGIKRFLNNLITNSDINFNTTANVGRIIFKPNEPSGFGGNLLSIYTTDENDTQGWIFDADGNLYYLGVGLTPIKIIFESTGNITAIGDISSANVLCDTIQSFSGGNITINNNLALGGNTISTSGSITGGAGSFTTGAFSSNVNITGTINCGNISCGSGTISTTGSINVGSINATSLTTGSGPITGGAGSFTTGAFSSNVNITGDINCGNISAGSGTISTTGTVNFGTINGTSLLTGSGPITGGASSFTTGAFSSNVNITGASNGLTISGGFSGLFCNKIESQSGGAIVSSAVFNLRSALAVTNITLDPLNTIRLKINGITGTNSYLFFNNSNLLGFFNTSTGTNTWTITDVGAISCNSINSGSGTISTTGSISGNSLSTNTISPISPSTTININTTSNFNWLKSTGLNRIKFYPSSTTGDLIQILRVDDSTLSSGYHYFNNSGTFGYISGGNTKYELLDTGIITCNTFSSQTTNTYINKIEMTNLYANPSVGEIDIIGQYIAVVHPSNTLSTAAKYGFFRTQTNGDTDFNINNISGVGWGTRWSNREFYTDFTFQCQKAGFTSGYLFSKFSNSGGVIGSISMFSASEVRFNQTSDYRLKQDIIDIPNPLERLLKLKPKNYRYIKNVEENDFRISEGFIAHEVEEILPSAVSGTKDDPENFQMLDYSSFTPLLTGAVQELNEKVDKMQLIIDTQQKMIDILIGRLDNFYKESSSLATSDNVIGGGGSTSGGTSTSIGGETSGTTSTCDAETSIGGSISDL